MCGVWHGPDGARRIAERVHARTRALAAAVKALGYTLLHDAYFDTIAFETDAATATKLHDVARGKGINLRALSATRIAVALDETVSGHDIAELVDVLALG